MLLIDILDYMPENQNVCICGQSDYGTLSTSASVAIQVLPKRILRSEVICVGSAQDPDTISILLKRSFTDNKEG